MTTHEFAFGFDAPPTANPWNTGHAPSGSSGGTGAALAAGFCLGGTGSDTGGSIRAPAAACGVSGIKPTYGRVSKHGVAVLSWSLDHTGPMARSARDLAVMLNVMAGPDPLDPTTIDVPVEDYAAALTGDISGIRIGVPRNFFFDQVEPAVEAAVRDAIAELESLNADGAFPPTGGPVRRRRTPPCGRTRPRGSDVTGLPVAPRLRLSSQISDWRNVEEKPVQKEQRDPQAYLAGRIDSGENAAAPFVDDNDISDRDFSQRGVVGAKFDCPTPVEARGTRSLSYTNGTDRIVVKRKFHLGERPVGTWR